VKSTAIIINTKNFSIFTASCVAGSANADPREENAPLCVSLIREMKSVSLGNQKGD
jgi:hypothetical protein